MSKKEDNIEQRGNDDSVTKVKGESRQTEHKGAQSVSPQDHGRHRKDESDGADRNTTKKQSNSI